MKNKYLFTLALLMSMPAFSNEKLTQNDDCYKIVTQVTRALLASIADPTSKTEITLAGEEEYRYYNVDVAIKHPTYSGSYQYEIVLSNDSASKCLIMNVHTRD